MPDLDDPRTKAALTASKGAAKRAVDDFLSSDEEKAQKEAERRAEAKSRRNKLIAYGVVGLLLVLGLVGLVLTYWQWFIALGLLGAFGLYGWHRWRSDARDEDSAESEDDAAQRHAESLPERPHVDDGRAAAKARIRAEPTPEDHEQAEALEERAIDEELEAMKTRLERGEGG